MRILLALIALGMVSITPAFAETVIFADFTTYEIAEVVEVRQFKNSPIVKTQGYTTVGGLFFIYESTKTDFTYAMILDRDGQWHKGEIREKTEVVIPEVTDIPPIVEQQENNIETRELLLVGKYTSHTFLKSLIQFDGKIYDKALNPTPSFYSNYGQVEDAIIRISIRKSVV